MCVDSGITNQTLSQNPAETDHSSRMGLIARELLKSPFKPHPLFTSGHAQTLAAYLWPRRFKMKAFREDEARLFEVEPGVRLLAHCRWQPERHASPTALIVHGLEGSSASAYMLGTAEKIFRAGFNTVRLNLRTCGSSEHLTHTFYHSGLTGDFLAVIRELIEHDRAERIFLIGFSMSGNMALRLAGAEAATLPPQLAAICSVSPSVDLTASANTIEHRSNWIYQQSFMRSIRRRMRVKNKLYPDIYDIKDLPHVRTIREFDERFTAVYGGFANVDDYYQRSSALPVIKHIRKPTLIIHAEDDPFIPFVPLRDPSIATNPNVLLLAPPHGGHVGFVSAHNNSEDRFWAENRIVQFCSLMTEGG
jgi:predicted alpha/beta-fold hydrolase